MRIKPLLTLFFVLFFGAVSVRAQVILGSRLVANANKIYTMSGFTPIDSFRYHYAGTHTSFMKTGVYQYDSAIRYLYHSGGYNNYEKYVQGFDINDSIFLGSTFRWVDTSSSWTSFSGYNKMYGTNGLDSQQITFSSNSGVLQPEYQYLYFYNASGKITFELRGFYNGTAYDSNMKTIYSYDSHNDLVKEISYNWDLTSGNFKPSEEKDYEYDTSHTPYLVNTYFHKSWDMPSASLKMDAFYVYTYDASNRVTKVENNEYNTSISAVVPSGRDTFMYDDSSNLATVINQSFDFMTAVYTYNKKYTWNYNDKNDPTMYMTYSWVAGAWTNVNGQDQKINYYYEDYTDAVKSVAGEQGHLQIYPIPAHNFVNIDIKWNKPQPFTIYLYDMQGRLVQKWDESAANAFKRTLPIPGLQSGNYIVMIKGANNQKMAQQIVVQ